MVATKNATPKLRRHLLWKYDFDLYDFDRPATVWPSNGASNGAIWKNGVESPLLFDLVFIMCNVQFRRPNFDTLF